MPSDEKKGITTHATSRRPLCAALETENDDGVRLHTPSWWLGDMKYNPLLMLTAFVISFVATQLILSLLGFNFGPPKNFADYFKRLFLIYPKDVDRRKLSNYIILSAFLWLVACLVLINGLHYAFVWR